MLTNCETDDVGRWPRLIVDASKPAVNAVSACVAACMRCLHCQYVSLSASGCFLHRTCGRDFDAWPRIELGDDTGNAGDADGAWSITVNVNKSLE